MKNEKTLLFGLQPTPPDPRDFSLSGVFGGINIDEVPLIDFRVAAPIKIKDQGNTDFCTGYSLTSVSEDQEGIELDPGFTFAMIKEAQGGWQSWGGDLRSGCKVATKIGFIEIGENPLDFGGKPRNFIANWNNWPLKELLPKAQKHRKESFYKVDGPYDRFDNIRAALWQNKNDYESVYTGCTWRPGWLNAKGGIIPKRIIAGGMGHAIKFFGQKVINNEPYLVCQNSFGTDVGDGGLYYFPREVINREFGFGSYMFNDMPVEEAKEILIDKGLYVGSPQRKKTGGFWNYLREIFS